MTTENNKYGVVISSNLDIWFDESGNVWLMFKREGFSVKILAEQALKMGNAIFNHFYGEENPMNEIIDKAYLKEQYKYCNDVLENLNKLVAPNTWQIMNNYKKRLEEQLNKLH